MRSHLLNFAGRMSSGLALFGAIGILAMLVHVTSDVVVRQLFNTPIPATVEIVSRYYMVLIAFLPLGWAELRGDMISVEVFSGMFKGTSKRLQTAFVDILTTFAYSILAYTTWIIAVREFEIGSFVISLSTAIPVWPSYFILPVAFAVAAIVTLLKVFLNLTPDDNPTDSPVDQNAQRSLPHEY